MMGRTISGVIVRGHSSACDAVNVLVLTMTDGSSWEVEGPYGGYTGRSCDEYKETISGRRVDA